MDLTITQEDFELYVTAAKCPNDEVFSRFGGSLAAARGRLMAFMDGYDPEDGGQEGLGDLAKRWLCLDAFYNDLPKLDLVLTGQGFGIVYSQNVMPASQQRTQALREQTRAERSDAMDGMILALLGTAWAEKPMAHALVKGLFPTAMDMRGYGVKTEDGKTVYREERERMAGMIREAEEYVWGLYGEDLYARLTNGLRGGTLTTQEQAAVAKTRRVMAGVMLRASVRELRPVCRGLMDYIEKRPEAFPAYTGSAAFRANHYERYENRKENAGFWFA